MNKNAQTLLTIAVFSILFISIAWVAPVIYVELLPEEQFIEMHSFEVSDTHVDADGHNLCLNRTVHRPSDADITVEMLLLREDGIVIEKDSFEVDAYHQKGTEQIIVTREIRTDSLEPGTYRYIESTKLTYYNGRVEKRLTFTSDNFTVYESKEKLENTSDTDC